MNSNTYNILYNSYYFLLKPIIILIIGIIIFKLWDWQFILRFIPSNNLTINLTINSIFLSYILYLIEEKINTNSSYIFVQMDKDKNNVNLINHQMKNISLSINDDKTTIVYVFIYVKGKINSHNNKLVLNFPKFVNSSFGMIPKNNEGKIYIDLPESNACKTIKISLLPSISNNEEKVSDKIKPSLKSQSLYVKTEYMESINISVERK